MLNIPANNKNRRLMIVSLLLMCSTLMACSDSTKKDTEYIITSGRINTKQKFSFQYGRMDVSAKLPKSANGLWPAIWLLGANQNNDWPACGEIDILEMGSKTGIEMGTPECFLTSGAHWGARLPNGSHPAYAKNENFPVSLQDGFHLYIFTWDETKIRVYIDPELDSNMGIVNPNSCFYEMLINVHTGEYPVGEYFHKPFFIVLNLAVGGDFPGIYKIDEVTALNRANEYEAKMYVDFVKVYNNANAENIKWQDLFDEKTLDASKWNIEINDDGGGNNELQSYRSQNTAIGIEPTTGKSCLILTAKKQAR